MSYWIYFAIVRPAAQVVEILSHENGRGWGLFKVVVTFNHEGGSFHLSVTPAGCLNNPIFSNLSLCAACWTRFTCHHKPLSSLNSSLTLAGGKHFQKITIPVFRLVLQNSAIPGWFLYILFFRFLFHWLPSGWFVGSISAREVVQY